MVAPLQIATMAQVPSCVDMYGHLAGLAEFSVDVSFLSRLVSTPSDVPLGPTGP